MKGWGEKMSKKETYAKRLQGVRQYLEAHGLNGAMFNSYENRRYYSGFTGSNGYLIISPDKVALVTDKRYTEQAAQQTEDCEIFEHAADRLDVVANTIRHLGIEAMVMEGQMTVDEYFPLKEKMGKVSVVFEEEYFLEQRMIKDEDEVRYTKEAIECAEAGFDELIPRLKIGMTEKDIADELHYLVSRKGAEGMSFDTIIGSGARGALAHAYPTNKKVENGDMVVIDFGVLKDGYCSDMTRTLLFGDVTDAHMKVFNIVQESQDAAYAAIRPGVMAKTVEDAHRAVFLRENLDDYSLRGLGHGIGLQIHECPRVVIGNETVLQPGMIFTLEPGLYFPDDCGVRTEDDVLVTAGGVENLSHTPHEIHIA